MDAASWPYRGLLVGLFTCASTVAAGAQDGVFVRFRLLEPEGTTYFVRLGGYIHNDPWYLPEAVVPAGADADAAVRVPAGEPTPWFDLGAHAGPRLHGRLNRAGGVAELPNVWARFITGGAAPERKAVIELATAPNEGSVVKRHEETFVGEEISFLVSPTLEADRESLETISQMEARHLAWAREATGGVRVSPKDLIVQTSFWRATPAGAQVLSLLGFNVVGNQTAEIHAQFPELRLPAASHDVELGLAATREQIDANMRGHAERLKEVWGSGAPFNLADEICARPPIGDDAVALQCFHTWLAERGIAPRELGVERLTGVVPIETPQALAEREAANGPAARRVFYYTSRFRQLAGSERIKWNTEAFHRHFPAGWLTSSLVADHPYFGGTGLGMGMVPNTAWGGAPLALDWFDMARNGVVDLAGIEDWMGLQYMYGPSYTWEGFQLMGFQAAMFRSGSRGAMPIISWITPSDETNLCLKSASALCQGAKHFFYWTYGPTAYATENYWSDLRSEYDGIARTARQLAAAEHILAPGKLRPTRVALMYSVSSDLWQPFGYIHMLERRATYLSLVHDQYLVDILPEEDVEAGRLAEYDALYVTDPCLTTRSAAAIVEWVRGGGHLYGSCGAGSRSEFNEPASGLSEAFGLEPGIETRVQEGEYRVRGNLNGLEYMDRMASGEGDLGVLGVKATIKPTTGQVTMTFADGSPAALTNALGAGEATYYAACPGLAYLKDAKFVPAELKEQYPPSHRKLINAVAAASGALAPVALSEPVVEAGLYDADAGSALVLANFMYRPLAALTARVPVAREVRRVRSVESGDLPFTVEAAPEARRAAGYPSVVTFTLPLDLTDIVTIE